MLLGGLPLFRCNLFSYEFYLTPMNCILSLYESNTPPADARGVHYTFSPSEKVLVRYEKGTIYGASHKFR